MNPIADYKFLPAAATDGRRWTVRVIGGPTLPGVQARRRRHRNMKRAANMLFGRHGWRNDHGVAVGITIFDFIDDGSLSLALFGGFWRGPTLLHDVERRLSPADLRARLMSDAWIVPTDVMARAGWR